MCKSSLSTLHLMFACNLFHFCSSDKCSIKECYLMYVLLPTVAGKLDRKQHDVDNAPETALVKYTYRGRICVRSQFKVSECCASSFFESAVSSACCGCLPPSCVASLTEHFVQTYSTNWNSIVHRF